MACFLRGCFVVWCWGGKGDALASGTSGVLVLLWWCCCCCCCCFVGCVLVVGLVVGLVFVVVVKETL